MALAIEDDQVRTWRLEQLLALGFSEDEARDLAGAPEVDLEQVRRLVDAGAPLELVSRITR